MASGIEPTDEFASFVQDLHDSEINAEIGWFFDGVWCVKIGDKLQRLPSRSQLRIAGRGRRVASVNSRQAVPEQRLRQGVAARVRVSDEQQRRGQAGGNRR